MSVIDSLVQLFAASTAMNMAYVALPDYRYRNKIVEFFEHSLRRRIHSDDDLNMLRGDVESETAVGSMFNQAKLEQDKKHNGAKPWLKFLLELTQLPKGEAPNLEVVCPIEQRKEKHWLQKLPGAIFRKYFLTHYDNHIAAIFVFIGLAMTAFQQVASIFPDTEVGKNLVTFFEDYKIALLILGFFTITFPALSAFVGRYLVCLTAFKAIEIAIEELIGYQLEKKDSQMTANIDATIRSRLDEARL